MFVINLNHAAEKRGKKHTRMHNLVPMLHATNALENVFSNFRAHSFHTFCIRFLNRERETDDLFTPNNSNNEKKKTKQK